MDAVLYFIIMTFLIAGIDVLMFLIYRAIDAPVFQLYMGIVIFFYNVVVLFIILLKIFHPKIYKRLKG